MLLGTFRVTSAQHAGHLESSGSINEPSASPKLIAPGRPWGTRGRRTNGQYPPWVRRLRLRRMNQRLRYLPFHAERAEVETDADRHAIAWSQVAPVTDFVARPGYAYRCESVAARSGWVSLIAGMTSPILTELATPVARATLHIPVYGEGRFHVDGRWLTSRAGATALYLPGLPHRCETTSCAGLSIGLDPLRLAAAAARLAGDPDGADRFLERFLQPLLLDQSDPLIAHLIGYLRRVVGLIDLAPSRSFELPSTLPLDQMVEKGMAVLAHPSLAALR